MAQSSSIFRSTVLLTLKFRSSVSTFKRTNQMFYINVYKTHMID